MNDQTAAPTKQQSISSFFASKTSATHSQFTAHCCGFQDSSLGPEWSSLGLVQQSAI